MALLSMAYPKKASFPTGCHVTITYDYDVNVPEMWARLADHFLHHSQNGNWNWTGPGYKITRSTIRSGPTAKRTFPPVTVAPRRCSITGWLHLVVHAAFEFTAMASLVQQ